MHDNGGTQTSRGPGPKGERPLSVRSRTSAGMPLQRARRAAKAPWWVRSAALTRHHPEAIAAADLSRNAVGGLRDELWRTVVAGVPAPLVLPEENRQAEPGALAGRLDSRNSTSRGATYTDAYSINDEGHTVRQQALTRSGCR
jgi:hypothetical protein